VNKLIALAIMHYLNGHGAKEASMECYIEKVRYNNQDVPAEVCQVWLNEERTCGVYYDHKAGISVHCAISSKNPQVWL
jgi:hypothetical protein